MIRGRASRPDTLEAHLRAHGRILQRERERERLTIQAEAPVDVQMKKGQETTRLGKHPAVASTMCRAARRPRLEVQLPSDSFQHQEGISEEPEACVDTPVSETSRQQGRRGGQGMSDECVQPARNLPVERSLASVHTSFQNITQKIERFLKVECEQRQKLYQNFSHLLETLILKSFEDAEQVSKQGEKLARIFQEQQKAFLHSQSVQEQKMEELKALCDSYLKKLEGIAGYQGGTMADELRKLIAALEMKLW